MTKEERAAKASEALMLSVVAISTQEFTEALAFAKVAVVHLMHLGDDKAVAAIVKAEYERRRSKLT